MTSLEEFALHMQCPDCGSTELHQINRATLKCSACTFEIFEKQDIIIALPSEMSQESINEDLVYSRYSSGSITYNENMNVNHILNENWRLFFDLSMIKRALHMEYDIFPYINKNNGFCLELGAGTGILALYIKLKHPEMELIVSDVSYHALLIAESIFRVFKQEAVFLCCDAQKIPLKSQEVDFAYASAAVHHMPDPVMVLKETKRVLKKGCYFIANEESPVNFITRPILLKTYFRREQKKAKELGFFENKYTKSEWSNFYKEAGLPMKIISDKHVGFGKTTTSNILRLLNNFVPQMIMDLIGFPAYMVSKRVD